MSPYPTDESKAHLEMHPLRGFQGNRDAQLVCQGHLIFRLVLRAPKHHHPDTVFARVSVAGRNEGVEV